MKILVFSNKISGHFLEYVHHVYTMAFEDSNNEYIFLVPKDFNKIKSALQWPYAQHIVFDLFDKDKARENARKNLLDLVYNSYRLCKFVNLKAKEYHADYIYANELIEFVPFAPLFFKRHIKLFGIIYRIYLHDVDKRSKFSIWIDKQKFKLMSICDVFCNVLILNDEGSANSLNKIYRTNKFISIPDPFNLIDYGKLVDIRTEYKIDDDKTLFVHFGSMNSNKGTIEILKSLKCLSDEERDSYVFVFAGKVNQSIKEQVYILYNELKDRLRVILIDEYCSFEFFAALCVSCNAILTPYRRTAQSSGLIGYASQYSKPVIAPSHGLLGNIVSKYKLGILIDSVNTSNLIQAYREIRNGNVPSPTADYCKDNSIVKFQEVLLGVLNK